MTEDFAAAVEAAQEYALLDRTFPDDGDDDCLSWERELRDSRNCLLAALAALSDQDASRVIAENPGLRCDGETTFHLVTIEEVQACRNAMRVK
ncbi:hypothetical protein [Burkholderia multivorans]|uniref:hypothetical protein n=1 Tax=Burkholderia multivorans TaxID=87883 RepID=UPI0009B8C0BA|nr:hypothetical protein [Burkholderia multivorans]MDR9230068.1 hypothetical protein [Burkholderia multivorans]HDR9474435.1 hypothetical protein [Burkholderia multivorans]HDR9480277.1 hypothetical protein [Burkholderia multivorans]